LEKNRKEIPYLQQKTREYEAKTTKLIEKLNQNGVTPDIYHSTLVDLSQEIDKIRETTELITKKLTSFHDLPPDPAEAHQKIQQTKNHLAQLEVQLANQIQQSMRL